MNMKLSLILGLIIAGFFPAISLYAWQTRPREVYSKEGSVVIAVNFLKNGPTFKFDGIPETVRVIKVETLRMPWTWEVTIAFQCRNSGYGDRTGKIMMPVITPHEIEIVVSQGKVIRAIIDGKWDEINQRIYA